MAINRKRLGYMLIGGGVGLALLTGVTVYAQVAEAERVKASLPTARVVIAAADIPPRTDIAATMLAVRTVPDELVQAGAATRVEDVVGQFSADGLRKGEVINTKRIGAAASRNAPSFKIERGKVMFVMPLSFGGKEFALTQVNALRAGDRVDLLYTSINAPQGLTADQREEVKINPIPYLQTRVMLQDLRIEQIGSYDANGTLVSATGTPGGESKAAPSLAGANVIFIVEPEKALVLKWLKDSASFYRNVGEEKFEAMEMVLRSPSDEEQADGNLVVNFTYMREKYNLPAPSANLTASRN